MFKNVLNICVCIKKYSETYYVAILGKRDKLQMIKILLKDTSEGVVNKCSDIEFSSHLFKCLSLRQ